MEDESQIKKRKALEKYMKRARNLRTWLNVARLNLRLTTGKCSFIRTLQREQRWDTWPVLGPLLMYVSRNMLRQLLANE